MLNIQKVVLLLSDEHLVKFKQYLEQNGSILSLKLVDKIEVCGSLQLDSDDLCHLIYGSSDEKAKRKFFQLAHHTFKLTSFLARNYPFYLTHNLAKIGKLVNDGHIEKANEHAQMLLDICEKVEDWTTQVGVLKFLSHQAFVMENQKSTLNYHERIDEVIERERTANELYIYLRKHLHFKDKSSLTNPDTESHISYFRQYTNNPSFSIRLISRFCIYHTMNYLDDNMFYDSGVLDGILELRKELEKHSYIIIHFADDIPLKVDYMYLKHILSSSGEETILKESMSLIKKWQHLQFWKGYINTPQIVSISIQASYLVTKYCYGYRHDREQIIPLDVQDKLEYLKAVSRRMLDKPNWESGFFVRYINLNNIYCSFLLLGGEQDCRAAIRLIEGLLINYQQISFQKLYDSIFVTLVIAYFTIKDHDGVQDCYKRYEKLTANQVKIEENDLTIKAFYYVSQWNSTHRKQYLEKLRSTYVQANTQENLRGTRKVIHDLIEYFEVPIPLEELPVEG